MTSSNIWPATEGFAFSYPAVVGTLSPGSSVTLTPTITGGTSPYTFRAIGKLPSGLSLNTTTGVISGTVGAWAAGFLPWTRSIQMIDSAGVYARNIATLPIVFAKNIACWGDSLTYGYGATTPATESYPAVLATLTGKTAYNGGVSGETSAQILTRYEAGTSYQDLTTIIEMGRNSWSTPDDVKDDIAAAVAIAIATTGAAGRYMILSIQKNRDPETDENLTIDRLNSDLRSIYGERFLPVYDLLSAMGAPGGEYEDSVAYAAGLVPDALLSDDVHLNTLGYEEKAKLIASHGALRRWWKYDITI